MEKMGQGSSASSQSDAGLTESCDPVAGVIPYPSGSRYTGSPGPVHPHHTPTISKQYRKTNADMDPHDQTPKKRQIRMFANMKQGASE